MSDTINALVVTLQPGLRKEDADRLKQAILMFKDVISVDMNVEILDALIAKRQAEDRLRNEMRDVLWTK